MNMGFFTKYFIYLLGFIILVIIASYPNDLETWRNFKKKKLCYNCLDLLIEEKDEQYYTPNNQDIAFWKKKESIYSVLPKPILTDPKFNAFKNNKILEFYPCNDNKCTTFWFDLLKFPKIKNKKKILIFFWATKKRDYSNLIIPNAKLAFDKYQNHGIVKSDINGRVKFKIRNPQPYHIDGKLSPPHLQFSYLLSNKTWSQNTYSIIFFPNLKFHKFKKILNKNYAIIINALPSDKGSIPNTIRIPYDDLDNCNLSQIFKDAVKKYQYRRFRKLINDNRLTIKNIPYVIYCKNYECDATTILFNYMLNMGYYNLMKFPGGLDEWYRQNRKTII